MGEVGGGNGHEITAITEEVSAIYNCRERGRGERNWERGRESVFFKNLAPARSAMLQWMVTYLRVLGQNFGLDGFKNNFKNQGTKLSVWGKGWIWEKFGEGQECVQN